MVSVPEPLEFEEADAELDATFESLERAYKDRRRRRYASGEGSHLQDMLDEAIVWLFFACLLGFGVALLWHYLRGTA